MSSHPPATLNRYIYLYILRLPQQIRNVLALIPGVDPFPRGLKRTRPGLFPFGIHSLLAMFRLTQVIDMLNSTTITTIR